MEYEEKEEYILLNFKDKVDHKMFAKPNLFFKIINLETPNPLIQIGNYVFTSKFDNETLGTSLIFEEQDELQPQSIYTKETNISLKYIAKTSKHLTLQLCKVPDDTAPIDPNEMVDLVFHYSYESVMKQIEDRSLDLNDVIKYPDGPKRVVSDDNEESKEPVIKHVVPTEKVNIEEELKAEAETNKVVEIPEDETFMLLKDLISQQANDPAYYNQLAGNTFQDDKEYMIMKEIYLKSLDYSKCTEKLDNLSVRHYVNLQGSIDAGIIEMKNELEEEDKKKLFSMENFNNFSLMLKILVLTDYLKEEKESWKNKTALELAQPDEFGRTARKRYKMVKSLVNDMKYNMFIMSREIDEKELE